ncbi:hypothetical protein [Brevundimonas sp.]|uniref:hypothetical protein n=1 Tax=Brevundimonas sp. TaxID=1871086 RepID=UPI002E116B8F|nr:hypothetical protein [Brevundimonas sp.]
MDPGVRGAVVVMGLIWTGIVLVNFALGDFPSAVMWAGVGIATTIPVVTTATASTTDRGRRATVCRDAKTGESL